MIESALSRLRWLGGRWGLLQWFGPPDPREPREVDDDLDDEFEFHLQMLQREEEAAGASPVAARAAAERRFGDIERVRRACRRIALWERTMIQRFNAVLTIVLLAAVVALGAQVMLGQRRTADTLDTIAARLETLDQRSAAASVAVADEANSGVSSATPVPSSTTPPPRPVEDPRGDPRRRPPVPTEETFDRTLFAWLHGDVVPRAVGVADRPSVLHLVWNYARQGLPAVYHATAEIEATIRRPRGDGSDDVIEAAWTGIAHTRAMAAVALGLPRVLPADRVELRIRLASPLPPLPEDWPLSANVDELRGALDVLTAAIAEATDEPESSRAVDADTLARYRAEHESVRLRLAAMGVAETDAPES